MISPTFPRTTWIRSPGWTRKIRRSLAYSDPAPEGDGDVAVATPPRTGQKTGRKTGTQAREATDPSTWGKVSRNAPCPCGSGKKYKHCHGRSG